MDAHAQIRRRRDRERPLERLRDQADRVGPGSEPGASDGIERVANAIDALAPVDRTLVRHPSAVDCDEDAPRALEHQGGIGAVCLDEDAVGSYETNPRSE